MAARNWMPTIIQQEFRTGDSCSGVAHTGAANPEEEQFPEAKRRVYRQRAAPAQGAIDGGLFELPSVRIGTFTKLTSLWVKLPGSTAVTVVAVDPDGIEYPLDASASDALVVSALGSWDLPPRWSIKITGNAVLTGPGKAIIQVDDWAYPSTSNPY